MDLRSYRHKFRVRSCQSTPSAWLVPSLSHVWGGWGKTYLALQFDRFLLDAMSRSFCKLCLAGVRFACMNVEMLLAAKRVRDKK